MRVATLTCDLAERADAARGGPFKDASFSREQMKELRYAGLLYDFGKVGVRKEVSVKSKKLSPVLLERIESRFELIRNELHFLSIPKRSLDPDKRKQIESHVNHTYPFLQEIPFHDCFGHLRDF